MDYPRTAFGRLIGKDTADRSEMESYCQQEGGGGWGELFHRYRSAPPCGHSLSTKVRLFLALHDQREIGSLAYSVDFIPRVCLECVPGLECGLCA